MVSIFAAHGLFRLDEAYLVHFEIPDGFAEETSGDEVEDTGGDDEENLDWGEVTTSVDMD